MPITQDDLTRLALEADEIVYRELTGAAFPTGSFEPPVGNGDSLPKFLQRTEREIMSNVQLCVRSQRIPIRKLDVVESSKERIKLLLYPTTMNFDLEIRIELNFLGVPYFSFYHNGVELF